MLADSNIFPRFLNKMNTNEDNERNVQGRVLQVRYITVTLRLLLIFLAYVGPRLP